MPNGPIFWYSASAVTSGLIFALAKPAGGQEYGLGKSATSFTDATWRLFFQTPTSLPGTTAKLRLLGLADNATDGTIVFEPKWASVAIGEGGSGASILSEGATSLAFPTASQNKYVETKLALDADTVVAGEVITMDLVIDAAATTLTTSALFLPMIIWE